MDLVFALTAFLVCVAVCMAADASLFWALLVGFIFFFAVGLRRGFRARPLLRMAVDGMKTTLQVLRILLLIGLLTALWRAGGTVAFFVRAGVSFITPHTFILVAFLLPTLFSLAFGSSFGVVGTAGVILMTIARSGGANLIVTAGAVMSGIYVGERLSPASSAAAMAAAVCGVDDGAFRNRMWRDTPVPLLLTLVVYGVLSCLCPIQQVDTAVVAALERGFSFSWLTALPAAALLVLPWFKLSAVAALAVSCALSALCAVLVQGMDPSELLRACLLGYQAAEPELAGIMSGGGLASMSSVVGVVLVSFAYSGMFSGTGLLEPVTSKVGALSRRIGLFPVHVLLSLGSCMLFCNQTVGTVMSAQLMEEEYHRRKLPPIEMAANVGNSVINLAGLVPWAIASSVPLATMEVGTAALVCAVYLYIQPLCAWVMQYRKEQRATEENLQMPRKNKLQF